MQFDILLLHTVDCPDCLIKSIGMFLAALLLGLLLGFILWYQYNRKYKEAKEERDKYHKQYTDMEKDFASLKYKFDELEKDNTGLHTSVRRLEADNFTLKAQLERARSQSGEEAKEKPKPKQESKSKTVVTERSLDSSGPAKEEDPAQFGFKKAQETNLTIVEGIGPKIDELLKTKGIQNWAKLAETSPETLQEFLDEAGTKFNLANPSTWPQQASLAAAGKWGELKKLQDALSGGV